ncbi:formin-like protein 1 isoform X2 [Kryptolebias marmoratus]|uniref:formin-like protein 1 isoform X2 n=1 Tax=Kryptolebias marmoratus TaxID=37003 RepID=UPI0007F92CC1|nr:formin-like protein 1 isoform X2 [Kryptolebias marmoratus]
MGNSAGSAELPQVRDVKEGKISGPEKHRAGPKIPMPPEEELEERFSAALNTMNLPPDKVKILSQYENEKKWDLICDQERFQVRNPPSAYLEKLRSFLDHGGNSRKFRRRVQESTQVLRELEISLRTNHIGWAQEFLNEDNQGLNVLVDYLSVAHSATAASETETWDNGTLPSDRNKSWERSAEDLSRSASNSPTNKDGASKGFTLRRGQRSSQSQKDDVHLCIMCLRAIMNYRSGFNLVMKHPNCVNEITLSLNDRNPRTKALVLELLAAVCLVRGGHDIILAAFNNFKEVCGERSRFEKLTECFRKEDNNIDFMVACMQFINIVVHSVENMNFRVHLQYEFTQHGLDDDLEASLTFDSAGFRSRIFGLMSGILFQRLKFTESDRLLVQIQAYLDNVFDVGALLEDAESKNHLLEHLEELQELNTQLNSRLQEVEKEAMEKVSELEKKLLQTNKEAELLKESISQLQNQKPKQADLRSLKVLEELQLRVQVLVEQGLLRVERSPSGQLEVQVVHQETLRGDETDAPPSSSSSSEAPSDSVMLQPPPPPPPPPPLAPPPPRAPGSGTTRQAADGTGCKQKKPIQTKYRLPLLNWEVLKSSQVSGTVFSELDDELVLQELNMDVFEEQFKTKAQAPPVDLGTLQRKMTSKSPSKVSLLEPNRAKNLAITLRKEGTSASDICSAIETYNQEALSLDFLELLQRFVPTESEMKLIQNFEAEGRPLDELSEEERFMVRFGKIPGVEERIRTLTFMGNFPQSVQIIQPQLNAVIAASMSIRSSGKLKKILEIILAFGNYMNSSKRGPAYGFRLQSLDLLLDTKSTDRRQTLLHFIVNTIRDKHPELQTFYTELSFLDKAALVWLDSVLQDLRALQAGMEAMKTQVSADEAHPVLQEFLSRNAQLLDSLVADGKTAQEVYESTVEYFGEDPKTSPPSMFFPVFVRFIKAFKAEQENQLTPSAERTGNKAVPAKPRMPQMDLIAELKRRQVSSQVREEKDGAIEDILTDLRNQPYRRTDGVRLSSKWKQGQQLQVSSDISL